MVPAKVKISAAMQLEEHLFRHLSGALPTIMNHLGGRGRQDRPPGSLDPAAPVDLLAVHKVLLIEHADLLDHRASYEHTGTERMVDGQRAELITSRHTPIQAGANQPRVDRKEVEEHLDQA